MNTTTTRIDLLRHAERLRRAAQLLEAHTRRCVVEHAPAHAEALRVARGMVRAVVAEAPRRLASEEERHRHE